MFGTAQIRKRDLAGLCRRLSTELAAGIDARRAWAREAAAARAASRGPFTQVSEAVNRGTAVAAAVKATGFFPTLFCELVEVGEQSGHLAEVFAQLAEHYDHQLQLRRVFLLSISWPMVQLGMALGVVGLLIWAMGFISQFTGRPPIDILGFGLVGTSGLIKYLLLLAVIAGAIAAIIVAWRRGMLWVRPIESIAYRVPQLGRCLNTLALARLSWSLYETMEAGMELRRALELSLQSTRHRAFISQIGPILASVRNGNSVHEAFLRGGGYPIDFLDTIEVGEASGRLVESLAQLARRYQDEARRAMMTLTAIAGFAVWALVAALIIALIFRIFGFYLGTLNQALRDAERGHF